MAGDIQNPSPAPVNAAPAADAGAAPVSAPAAAPAPAVEPSVSPAPVASPVTPAEGSPEPSAPVEPAAPAPVTDPAAAPAPATTPESVLGDSPKTPEGAPKEGEKPADAKPEVAPEAKELPVFEPFKLPENVSLAQEPMAEFSKLLGEIEIKNLDHAGLQEVGQKLVDMHIQGVNDTVEKLYEHFGNVHEQQKMEWFEAFKSDPEIGGNRMDTTVTQARAAIDTYAGAPEQVAEFRQLMKDTGVGNHPALIRLISNMQEKINKFTTEGDAGNGGSNRMVPAQKPAPVKVKPYQTFYSGGSAS